jgi:protoporphyrin/coproporphyrin ferrochelatase
MTAAWPFGKGPFAGKKAAAAAQSMPKEGKKMSVGLAGLKPDDKVGIMLLNLGGPEKLDEVEDFLFNLFNDEDIIRLPNAIKPLQGLIARRIASSRAPGSREAYESIGGGSPLTKLTNEQGEKLVEELGRRGIQAKSYVGMRYWYPFTEEAVDEILKDGVNRLVILPMYPQYSISTTGSSIRLLDKMIRKNSKMWDPRSMDHTVIPDWFDHPGFVKAQAKFINRELEEFKNTPDEVKVLFSAHGVPESYIKAGDPYKDQIEKCVELIMAEVNKDHPGKFKSDLSFQSKVGPVKWLDPYTEVTLEEMGKSGLKNVVVVPLSFVQEHVETLEEIDQEFAEVAEEAGIEKFKRVPALNSDPDFIKCLADMTIDALEKPSLRVSETLNLYQNAVEVKEASLPFGIGVNLRAEKINGRVAMLALASLAVSQVIKSGCPAIDGPAIAGKEPFCAAFSAEGWQWLADVVTQAFVN